MGPGRRVRGAHARDGRCGVRRSRRARAASHAFVAEIAAGRVVQRARRRSCCSSPAPACPTSTRARELWETSLVDPDNRRAGRLRRARRMLAQLDADSRGASCRPSTRRARRSCSSPRVRCACGATAPSSSRRYTPMTVVGEAADHAIAFDRGGAVTVATRLPVGLAARGRMGRHGAAAALRPDDGCPHGAPLRGLDASALARAARRPIRSRCSSPDADGIAHDDRGVGSARASAVRLRRPGAS